MYAASLGISVDFNFTFCIHVDHIDGKKKKSRKRLIKIKMHKNIDQYVHL